MIIDTYDLGNGYRAELVTGKDEELFSIYIIFGKEDYKMYTLWFWNPFDAIFILMDLGLMGFDVDWCEPREFSYRES